MSDLRRIVEVYDSRTVRAYATVRFRILDLRFIDEIGQYLPESGRILDIGCGFGLFALAFGVGRPQRRILGIDISVPRIERARTAARRLGADNVEFTTGDARDRELPPGPFDAVYLLDIVHHVPREAVDSLLVSIRSRLRDGGVLLVKDVDARPAYKRWFTWLLDKLVDPSAPVNYWPVAELRRTLVGHGFTVHVHQMRDLLPYPHVLYICRLPDRAPAQRDAG
jgi:2-polyprenyl-3-methyl-5-hydroxy-6-metoxy-1,4-benzoquinol methylase